MNKFKLETNLKPAGDQIEAIKKLIFNLENKVKNQVLLGATGTGKTFTIANVIQKINKPTIVLSPNKTLASQLYIELKSFFPNNHVEYFISNFDYYRPEAYMPNTDTYIDKTSKSNWDIEAMRMSALNSLLTYSDTIIVASVASIYGQLSPKEYISSFINIAINQKIKRDDFLFNLVKINYARNDVDFTNGKFRVKGDIVDIFPSWTKDFYIRVGFFDDEIEFIQELDVFNNQILKKLDKYLIYPAQAYTTSSDTIKNAIKQIKIELEARLKELKSENKLLEYQRLEQRIKNDIESLEEFGYCPGIENYSRFLDNRLPGERPFTILDFFPKDSLMVIDESHIMIGQLKAMYAGDYSRKKNLVDYGFRLPAALDNRPLKFEEFENFDFLKIYVSATPDQYEIEKSNGNVVSQIVRPTGLLDPVIEIRNTLNQSEDIFNLIQAQKAKNERTIILTITKKMAEQLSNYLKERGEKTAYIHSDHKTFERDEILRKLRKGVYDTVVGINLLREGIDIPEISLICILDADKDSFFRSSKSLIQIIGRAARNVNGKVIFYADKISNSMQQAMDETQRRREIQIEHNKKHHIIPQTIIKPIPLPLYGEDIQNQQIEKILKQKNKKQQIALIDSLRKQMHQAAKELNFERATQLRDLIIELEVEIE